MSRKVILAILALFAIPFIAYADINNDLFKAVRKGDIQKVKTLIAEGADMNATDKNGACR